MTKEQFENNINWKMTFEELTYEEFEKYDCIHFDKKDCIHSNTLGVCLSLMAV